MSQGERQIVTRSLNETHQLGKTMGLALTDGCIFALTGDLGSGKTAFVQGLAWGLGIPENHYITSPTFTLINEYMGRLRLFHIDLYRIQTSEDLEGLGLEEILSSESVIAIEWPETVMEMLQPGYVDIRLKIIDDACRKFFIVPYGLRSETLIGRLCF